MPKANDWAVFPKDSITMKDIAFLTAKTGDEFAILAGKKEDILFHGVQNHCVFSKGLSEMLTKGQLKLYGHSHPGERYPMPSYDDRETLKLINQRRSRLVSAVTGREIEFSDNAFDESKDEQTGERSEFGYVDSE